MASETCQGCSLNYFKAIATFHSDDLKALKFFRDHCVLPSVVFCPTCKRECYYRESDHVWLCGGTWVIRKTKKRRRCDFSVSDFKGSFLTKSKICPWKLLLLINHFVSHAWDHGTIQRCLQMSETTTYMWHQFCCEVTDAWLSKQQAIGGPGVVVEIGEGRIASSKQDLDKPVNQIRLFGGIERVSKKFFVTALSEEEEEEECLQGAGLLSMVEKLVVKDSIVYSRGGTAYKNINQLGYSHFMTKSSVASDNREIHVRSLDCFWRGINQSVKKPGLRPEYLYQYITHYLFIKSSKTHGERLHRFLVEAGQLYPPQGDRDHVDILEDGEIDSDKDS